MRERDAAIDALGVARRDLESALESSRLDALEARRAAAVAEGRARAAVLVDQKDLLSSGRYDRRDRDVVAVEDARSGSNGDAGGGERSLFGSAGGAYTVQHPASPAKRGETKTISRRDASSFSPRAGPRGVVSAPSPLRRVGSHAPHAPDAPANVEGGEDALAAFTRTAPREGW